MQQKTVSLIIVTAVLLGVLFALPALLSAMPRPAQPAAPPAPQNQAQAGPAAAHVPSNSSRPSPFIDIPKINISNQTITSLAPEPSYNLSKMEMDIHNLVNREREKAGLKPLAFNPDIAAVARLHSGFLAKENGPLTDPSLYCPQPFIHHEGFDFGLYETDRMYNRSIYYFSAAGENIFMTSTWSYLETYSTPGLGQCPDEGAQMAKEYAGPDAASQVQADYRSLLDYVKTAQRVNWTSVDWYSQPELEGSVVDGWMGSPGHRANILNGNYTEEGIGVAKVNDFIIVTEDFIDRTDCGYTGASCCPLGDSEQFCYEPWKCDGETCS
jgi:uncharacterized protein YkwD